MRLIVAHQVLIAAAIGLALIFAARGIGIAVRGGGSDNAAMAGGALVVAIGLAFYLGKVRAGLKKADGAGKSP